MDEPRQITAEGEDAMMLDEFDKKLIAARPDNYRANDHFTDAVMAKITKSEIFSSSIRTMNATNQETFMNKIKHLPAFAIIAIIVASVVVVSGSAYAAYQLLWPKPQVHVSSATTSSSGRKQVKLSLAECGSKSLASGYELKKNATITIDDVPMVVQAHCELDAIGTWADKTFPHDKPGMTPITNKPYDKTRLSTSMATHIASKSGTSITFAGLTKFNQTDTTLDVTADTQFVAGGQNVKPDAITPNDPIVYITSETIRVTPNADCTADHCSSTGKTTSTKLVAVVKLSQPFQYYDQLAWQSLAERDECAGNPTEQCLSGYVGAIDLHQGSASIELGTSMMKQIQGAITAINGTTVTLRGSSGALYTITLPTDAIGSYNTNKAAQYYNNQRVAVGSTLIVRYAEATDQHSKTISADQLSAVQLMLEIIGKSSPVKAY